MCYGSWHRPQCCACISDVIIVIKIQRVCELRLQSWITLRDVERIRVVGDVEQLGDVRLTGVATILYTDGLLVTEFIMEVKCWREIGDITDGVDINATIVLDVVGVLRLDEDTDVIVVFLMPVA